MAASVQQEDTKPGGPQERSLAMPALEADPSHTPAVGRTPHSPCQGTCQFPLLPNSAPSGNSMGPIPASKCSSVCPKP